MLNEKALENSKICLPNTRHHDLHFFYYITDDSQREYYPWQSNDFNLSVNEHNLAVIVRNLDNAKKRKFEQVQPNENKDN